VCGGRDVGFWWGAGSGEYQLTSTVVRGNFARLRILLAKIVVNIQDIKRVRRDPSE